MGWHGKNQQAQEIIISCQVGTTHLPAAEGTKSRVDNLFPTVLWYIDRNKLIFFGSFVAYTKTISPVKKNLIPVQKGLSQNDNIFPRADYDSDTLRSVFIFSILFSRHFIKC